MCVDIALPRSRAQVTPPQKSNLSLSCVVVLLLAPTGSALLTGCIRTAGGLRHLEFLACHHHQIRTSWRRPWRGSGSPRAACLAGSSRRRRPRPALREKSSWWVSRLLAFRRPTLLSVSAFFVFFWWYCCSVCRACRRRGMHEIPWWRFLPQAAGSTCISLNTSFLCDACVRYVLHRLLCSRCGGGFMWASHPRVYPSGSRTGSSARSRHPWKTWMSISPTWSHRSSLEA